MKKAIVSLLAVAGMATVASAQTYEGNFGPGGIANQPTTGAQPAVVRFQVWDGAAWTNSVNTVPGGRVEWRVVVSYTGTRTDLNGLGDMGYQPVIGNADNDGVQDTIGAYLDGGLSGNAAGAGGTPAGLLGLTAAGLAEANSGAQLTGYGRVRFGSTAANATSTSTLTSFRHTAGSNGAPAGSFIRLAGQWVSSWPIAIDGALANLPDGSSPALRVSRGVIASQLSQNSAGTFFAPGVSDLTIFRQAFIAGDALGQRTLSTFIESFRRAATGAGSTDNRRYIAWQTGPNDGGAGATGHRTAFSIEGATINVIPTPGAVALLGLGGLLAARRRRA